MSKQQEKLTQYPKGQLTQPVLAAASSLANPVTATIVQGEAGHCNKLEELGNKANTDPVDGIEDELDVEEEAGDTDYVKCALFFNVRDVVKDIASNLGDVTVKI